MFVREVSSFVCLQETNNLFVPRGTNISFTQREGGTNVFDTQGEGGQTFVHMRRGDKHFWTNIFILREGGNKNLYTKREGTNIFTVKRGGANIFDTRGGDKHFGNSV